MNLIEDEFTLVKAGRTTKRGPKEEPEALPIVPRITRLMALAIKIEDMVGRGELRRLRGRRAPRPRHPRPAHADHESADLAPDIQGQILIPGQGQVLPAERQLRHVASCVEWGKQRRLWKRVSQTSPAG